MSVLKTGLGRRKPQLDIPINQLHPDSNNPRLPKEYQGKQEKDILEAMYKFFNLQELALSMIENGYFDAEPLVAIPDNLPEEFADKTADELSKDSSYINFIEAPETHFLVVEGNRRVSTVKLLLNKSKKNFPSSEDEEILNDLKKLPVIVYPRRKDVLAYLGARHIIGTKKWDAYAKARYIASLKEDHQLDLDDIQRTVGDTAQSARKIYASYRLIELIEEEYEDIDISEAKENFSFLILATGQGAIKEYIGLEKKWQDLNFDSIIPKEKTEKLKNLFIWLFGDGKTRKVIRESRDITNVLTPILRNETSTSFLEKSNDLTSAFELSDGEQKLLSKYLSAANLNLQKSLQFLHRYKEDSEVKEEVKRLSETLDFAKSIVSND